MSNLIDLWYSIREERLKLERQAQDLKAQESRIKMDLLTLFRNEDGIRAMSGQKATAALTLKVIPKLENFKDLVEFAYMEDSNVLCKQIAKTVWREYYDNKILIPGTEPFDLYDISLTKGKR